MCTPSKRERRFDDMTVVTPSMSVSPRRERRFCKCARRRGESAVLIKVRFLRVCSKMSISRRREGRLEKRDNLKTGNVKNPMNTQHVMFEMIEQDRK
jgi:hypothetical protein